MKTKTKIIIAVAVAIVLLAGVICVGLFTINKNKEGESTTVPTTAPFSETDLISSESTTLFDWEEYREQLLSTDVSGVTDVSGTTEFSAVTQVVSNVVSPSVYISYVYVDSATQSQTVTQSASKKTTTKKSTTSVQSNEMIDFQYTYDSASKTVTLNKYTGGDTTVVIPSTVNGNKIVKIGTDCFKGKSVELVYVGKNIEAIGDRAFKDCKKLNQVFFMGQESVTIGASAFEGCTGLTYIALSNGTTEIGDNCFADCTSLTKMSVPSSVTAIGANPWSGCNVTLTVKEGSVAHQKALAFGFNEEDNNLVVK